MTSGPLSYNSPEQSRHPGLAGKVIQFSDFLKNRGFKVSHSGVHDAIRSMVEIDPSIKEDFLATLRANLVKNDIEWNQFTKLFFEFWIQENDALRHSPGEDYHDGQHGQESNATCNVLVEAATAMLSPGNRSNHDNTIDQPVYSPLSTKGKKDFTCFDKTDIPIAQQALKKILKPFWIHESRRLKKSKKWNIDFPRVMRKSLKYKGLPLELHFKAKKRKLKRLVFLIDISGSMERYARLVLPFILSLRVIGSKAEIFVFSTALVSISAFVRHMHVDQIFDNFACHVPDWSGGTRIGHSLHQFNQNQGPRLLSQRTVVVILSDGWDLGEKELLRQEMMIISRNANSIIWLNPLAGDPDYQPLCQGMKAALPYIDYFLPADSLEGLKKAGLLITRIMTT
ncbi:VWA domain-containing protein [Thermodesulfobacteriota bacterium]